MVLNKGRTSKAGHLSWMSELNGPVWQDSPSCRDTTKSDPNQRKLHKINAESNPTQSPDQTSDTEEGHIRSAEVISYPRDVIADSALSQLHAETHDSLSPKGRLEAQHLGKSYRKRPAVQDVSIAIRQGEAVGLLGPNGAGKTTCFYLITGLIRPDQGQVYFNGQDITDLPMYRRARLGIGYLPQENSVFRGLSAEKNIMAMLEIVEPDKDQRHQILEDLLDEFQIKHIRKTPAIALSGGERRRLEIARALATQPAIMLLDEPLAGIDPIAVADIRDLVIHLTERGIGILITDHNVRETLDIVDRAYIIYEGRVLMAGRPDEVIHHNEVRRFYLGKDFTI